MKQDWGGKYRTKLVYSRIPFVLEGYLPPLRTPKFLLKAIVEEKSHQLIHLNIFIRPRFSRKEIESGSSMQAHGPLMIEHRLIERMIAIISNRVEQAGKTKEMDPLFVDQKMIHEKHMNMVDKLEE